MSFPEKILRLSVQNKYHATGVIFFILMAIAFNLTIIQTTNKSSTHNYRMKLYYPRIDGFSQGTAVYIQGIEKGYIEEINVVPATFVDDRNFPEKGSDKIIELTIAMTEPVNLWNNYKVNYNSVSLFSGRVLDIDPGYFIERFSSHFNPFYLQGKYIPDIQPVANYHDNAFTGISLVMEENKESILNITRDLREITGKLNSAYGGSLPRLISSEQTWNNMDKTILDASIMMQEFRWYAEGYPFMDNSPNVFFVNLVRQKTLLGTVSNDIFNQVSSEQRIITAIEIIKNRK